MRAIVLGRPAPIETSPLRLTERTMPEASEGEIRVRVTACGVCRTDLHVTEGDLPPKHATIVPGHEVVGVVEALGPGAKRFACGDRVGIAWLRETDGTCAYCRGGRENLCPNSRFTGWDHDGGYAEYAVVREDFAYALPPEIDDEHAAPLLCAGIIGYRAIKRAGVFPGATVGLYGFGGSAHLALQVLKHWKCRVFVMSRGGVHRELAEELGADWIGEAAERPPALLDSAILFAPAGDLVPPAMQSLDRGGILAIAGIYLSPIPSLNYERDLFYEREIHSVTANTRADGEEFLRIAGEIPIKTHTVAMPLADANRALTMLKRDELRGAAVLHVDR
ncbi:MAG TPA: zinc-dependent alcohol dehydrogenase family protein [Candidatus Cybelea sp.]|jgi:propanol-preferring alcohol dehydrogenase|nr:zinc-dependent alcohol dehydrogenase family protein [Candidatus Cybelea sp.]